MTPRLLLVTTLLLLCGCKNQETVSVHFTGKEGLEKKEPRLLEVYPIEIVRRRATKDECSDEAWRQIAAMPPGFRGDPPITLGTWMSWNDVHYDFKPNTSWQDQRRISRQTDKGYSVSPCGYTDGNGKFETMYRIFYGSAECEISGVEYGRLYKPDPSRKDETIEPKKNGGLGFVLTHSVFDYERFDQMLEQCRAGKLGILEERKP